MDGVIRVAIAKLRNLSNEFKEARRIPAAERKEVVSGLAKRASETLVRCWDCGYLRSILSLNQRLEELEAIGCASSHSFGGVVFRLFLFDHLVGYFDAIFEEIDEPYTYINDEGEVIETEVTNQYCYLNIGMLAQDGLLDTPPIFIGQGSVTEKEIQRAKIENSFEVLGYYSLGCEVLVEILEREVALESDDRTVVDARRPEDGFSEDGRTFRWCGRSYSLPENPSKVVRVLYHAYLAGTKYLSEQYIKTEAEVESDIRHIVRDNDLSELIIPEVDSDGKRVKGKWGLMPRTK